MTSTDAQQFADAGPDDWREFPQSIHARFLTGDLAGGLAFVAAVGEASEHAGAFPRITVDPDHVDVRLPSHGSSDVTVEDFDLARRISLLAREQGLRGHPDAISVLELALDTADAAAVGPFWAALLTGDPTAVDGDDVVDPTGRMPLLWFQSTEPHGTPRQRFHLDVWVPQDVADDRIAAAVAAGGRIVDSSSAPSFTVLADAEGNRACVCTTLGR